MRWAEISALVTESRVEKTANILGMFGQGGPVIEERDSENTDDKQFLIKAYLPGDRHLKKTESEIMSRIAALPFQVDMAERFIKPDDWLEPLKEHFSIQEIGSRFIVKPSWIQEQLPDSARIVLELDPGAAFGTGLHPTTRLCLLGLEKHLKTGMNVFDLGTGTGILSIAAAKLGAGSVEAVDIDPVAITTARCNVRINRVEDKVNVKRGTLSISRQRAYKNGFDLVLANISVTVIIALSDKIADILAPGGRTICSGISTQGLDEVMVSLALADLKIESINRDGEWYAISAVKAKKRQIKNSVE
jgi:ribosomal protein L11 methyltransferase